MLRPIDLYFANSKEPAKSCLEFMRAFIPGFNSEIREAWKYGMPFYCINQKMFCYLWVDKKNGWPYLGIVDGRNIDHPDLVAGNRARMKILMLDPAKDLPVEVISEVLAMALAANQFK